ncbi:hypothetical protein BN1723_020138, partial [Verticillium longisporum]
RHQRLLGRAGRGEHWSRWRRSLHLGVGARPRWQAQDGACYRHRV